MKTTLPIAPWISDYQLSWLRPDLIAGITVAVLLIPQSMAYAMLAGLPPITGMYAALAALIAYALTGSSRHMSVGPAALDSILLASGVSLIATAGSDEYLAIAILLAALVGIVQLGMGFLRLGFMVNFLANPVISGFTSASAIIIGASQLKHLLGIEIPSSQTLVQTLSALVQNMHQFNPVALGMGLAGIVAMWAIKHFFPRAPAALVLLVLATIVVWLTDLDQLGINVIGKVPEGLPTLSLPVFDHELLARVLPLAITIALIGFMESISMAKRVAADQRYKVNSNRELVGLGCANIASGVCGGYPVAGSLSRTAVNASNGAHSQLSSLFTAAMLALVLVALTPLFYYTPQVCLAVIIISALMSLIDLDEPRRLWRVNKKELIILVLAFVATLLMGVQNGILLSVMASIVLIFSRITRPPVAEFGQSPENGELRNIAREANARIIPGLLVFRIDSSLYFANASYLEDRVFEALSRREDPIKAFLFDASSINEIDSSAISALDDIAHEFRELGIEMYLTNVRGRVLDMLQHAGFYDNLGADHFFYSKRAAIAAISQRHNLELPHPVAHGTQA